MGKSGIGSMACPKFILRYFCREASLRSAQARKNGLALVPQSPRSLILEECYVNPLTHPPAPISLFQHQGVGPAFKYVHRVAGFQRFVFVLLDERAY